MSLSMNHHSSQAPRSRALSLCSPISLVNGQRTLQAGILSHYLLAQFLVHSRCSTTTGVAKVGLPL